VWCGVVCGLGVVGRCAQCMCVSSCVAAMAGRGFRTQGMGAHLTGSATRPPPPATCVGCVRWVMLRGLGCTGLLQLRRRVQTCVRVCMCACVLRAGKHTDLCSALLLLSGVSIAKNSDAAQPLAILRQAQPSPGGLAAGRPPLLPAAFAAHNTHAASTSMQQPAARPGHPRLQHQHRRLEQQL